MKVGVMGNTLNFAFMQAKEMRKRNVDTLALIEKGISPHYHPCFIAEDFSYKKYPFVHEYSSGPKSLVINNKLYSILNDCDLIHITGPSLPLLWRFKRPILFTSMGADINSVPFYSKPNGQFNFSRHIRTFLMRKALSKPTIIEIAPFQKPKAEKLKLNNIRYIIGLFSDICYDEYDRTFRDKINHIGGEVDHLFIHLSRHYWGFYNRVGKGNDIFIRSLETLKDQPKKVKVILIEKGPSVNKSKKLITNLGLDDYCMWLPELNRLQARAIYKAEKLIVFDNFDNEVSDLGYIGRETLLTGNILVSNYKNGHTGGSIPPVFSCYGSIEILKDIIKKILNGGSLDLDKQRQRVKDWSSINISNNVISEHYNKLYSETLLNFV